MACTIGVIWCVLIGGGARAGAVRYQAAHPSFGDAELAGQLGRVGAVELLRDLR